LRLVEHLGLGVVQLRGRIRTDSFLTCARDTIFVEASETYPEIASVAIVTTTAITLVAGVP
jgi:hypothetical protein